MADSGRFAVHRPELLPALMEGERKLATMMHENAQRIAAGRVLIRANSEHEFVYRLREGWACRRRAAADGRGQFILVFLPGDFFAVKSMYVTCHFDDVQVLSDAVVEKLHYKEVYRACSRDPDIALRCTWQVIEEERRLHSWVFNLGQGNAEERLAFLFTDLRGRLVASRTIGSDSLNYEMPLTQPELADHVGITAIHVNRVLKSLRDRGVVTVRDGKVTIHDLDALTRMAEPLMDAYERKAPQYNISGRAQ
jgi:CRP/FNR family transcriptional regulator, anaerobic regulatory protein